MAQVVPAQPLPSSPLPLAPLPQRMPALFSAVFSNSCCPAQFPSFISLFSHWNWWCKREEIIVANPKVTISHKWRILKTLSPGCNFIFASFRSCLPLHQGPLRLPQLSPSLARHIFPYLQPDSPLPDWKTAGKMKANAWGSPGRVYPAVVSQVGMETLEKSHAPCKRAASVLESPEASLSVDGPTISQGSPACAEATESYFAVGEGCALICSAITQQQQHTATVPCLQGLLTLHLRHSWVSNYALRYCLGCFNMRLLQCSALWKGKE